MGDVIRIMVVDDEAGICRNVEKILTKNDFEVTSATSAREALEIMQKQSFNLMITDIVMPQMNGLELLKKVKSQWPETKALTMTAFASTDTAHRAIRLGALDYLPKPFTPAELRNMVNDALSGKLIEARVTDEERNQIDVIDVDVPFDVDEVAEQTGDEYTKMLGRGDMPVVEVKISEPIEGFCEVGAMVCDIFKKLGATCKAGVKTSVCPQLKKKKKAKAEGPDVKSLVGIDQPFGYDEVVGVTGPEYVHNLQSDGVVVSYYDELKENVARIMAETPEPVEAVVTDEELLDTDLILVIDDEVAVNNNIRKILGKTGYGVDQATTKEEALAKINNNAYALILLDLKIPGVRGLELMQRINDRQPKAKVIMITGYASVETAKEAARLGAIEYLPKPFTPNEIREATDRAFRSAA